MTYPLTNSIRGYEPTITFNNNSNKKQIKEPHLLVEEEEKKKEGFSYEKTGTSETSDTKTAEANEANIVITSNDLMQYNIKEIKVKAGQKVKLTLRHIGKLDINIMGHNLVILKQGVNFYQYI